VPRLVRPARAEIDRKHRLNIGEPTPVDEFVGPELVGFDRFPGEIHAARALFNGPNPFFPVVARDEIAARIAHDRWCQLPHQIENVAPEAVLVRRGMSGFKNAAIDASSEMLDESPEETP